MGGMASNSWGGLMVRYWIEWIDHGTNDRHTTDLHESLDEAMKAVPTWRAYNGSVKAYQTEKTIEKKEG